MNNYQSSLLDPDEQNDLEQQPDKGRDSTSSSLSSHLSLSKANDDHSELEVFREMLERGHFCDVEITVKNEKKFRAHGIILASKSNYFKSLFTDGFLETFNRSVDLSDINEETMKTVLQYIYGKDLELTFHNVCSLLVCADRLLVDGLRTACVEFIQKRMTEERAVEAWNFATSLNFADLKKFCQRYILFHFDTMNHNNSSEICSLSGKDLLQFLKNDKLRVSSETDVLYCINKWINEADNPDKNRSQDRYLCYLLFEGVRLSKLDKQRPFGGFPVLETHVKNCSVCKRFYNLLMLQISTKKIPHDPQFSEKEYQRAILWHRPRAAHQVILAVGGWSGQYPTACVELYNPQNDQWRILQWDDDMHRAYHGLVILNDILYIVGGYDGTERLNTMHAFDRKKLKWIEKATMHDRRCYVCAVSCGNYVYAIGGHDGNKRLKTVERYNPLTNQWTYLQSMTEIRSDAHAVVLNEKIYVIGGFDGDIIHRSVEVYSPSTNTWTFLVPMNNPRSGVKAATYNGTIYALGGFDGQRRLKTIEYWNQKENCWVVETAEMNIARSNFGVAVYDRFLTVIGGYDDDRHQTTSHCEMYSVADRKWYPISFLPNRDGISALSIIVVDGLDVVNEYLKSSRSRSRSYV